MEVIKNAKANHGEIPKQNAQMYTSLETFQEEGKPDHCKICNKAFKKKYYLNTHIANVHENSKPYKCKICDKGSSIKDIRFFWPFFDLPTHPYPSFSQYNDCFLT